ncbi:MAG: glycosyltransferase family 2 protein [Patescibacteria group bacterium]|nr:glycosyltransferase family 2 protein [Patescibacteria group bacterium]
MKVSIIIVNYNGKNYLTDCLASVLKTNVNFFEVIVVDNASSDGSVEKLNKRVKLIRSKTNLFFTGGCNLGAKKAKGEWLVFLNPDTVVEPDWLTELVKEAKDKKLTLQPKIKIYGTDRIDCVIGKYFWPGFGIAIGRGKADKYERIIKGDYANGTCLMINKNWFWHLGGFDENFKFFYEDADLQLRAKKQGGRAIGVMKAVIYHKGSLSFKQNMVRDEMVFYYRRNRLVTVLKNFSGFERWVRWGLLAGVSLVSGRLKMSIKAVLMR